jgi:hypothetical protein
MSGATNSEIILATVSTGSSTTQVSVDISSSTTGTYVPISVAGSVGNNPLVVFNWDPETQLTHFLAAQKSGAGAKIVGIGNSTTIGFGSAATGFRELSYLAEMSRALTADGVAAQSDNFLGQGNENGDVPDERITFFGGAAWSGAYDAGGQTIETDAAGQGFQFTLPTAHDYNQVTLSYIDIGSGALTLSVDGVSVGTLQVGNTGNTLTQTFDIPAGAHTQLTVTATDASPVYIQGASFSNSTSSAVQVLDAGIGGWGTTDANTSVYNGQPLTGSANGYGQTAGSVALQPNLAIIDYSINDITGADNLGVPVLTATIVENLKQMIATLRAAGSDVILVLPQPFNAPQYALALPALRAGLETLAIAENVPLIDLSASYGDSFSSLYAAGLMSDSDHPDATFYADIGTQMAALLTNATTGYNNSGMAVTLQGTSGNDTLTGTASVNTLLGNGGSDTYVINASDQSDTIINNSDSSTVPSGEAVFSGLSYDQLWFAQSGNNLVITVLGADRQVVVQNWFAAGGGQALADIAAADATLPATQVTALVQAMAAYTAANLDFNPTTTDLTNLQNSGYGSVLQSEIATAWDTSPVCFCAGTQILTPSGLAAIETLSPGDQVVTLHSGAQTIKWIGRRSHSAAFANAGSMTRPVRIAANALDDGVPARPLYVSPGHALEIDGMLLHAWRLINGVSISQPSCTGAVTYFHIELTAHEIIFAENCPTETFRDEAFRRYFTNPPDCAGQAPPNLPSCLPLLQSGFQLEAIRTRLARRAGVAPQDIVPPGPLAGYVDGVYEGELYGWAWDTGMPETPVCLGIYADGRKISNVLANGYRADLRKAGIGSGLHGFSVPLPDGVDGEVEVRRLTDGALLPPTEALRRAAIRLSATP